MLRVIQLSFLLPLCIVKSGRQSDNEKAAEQSYILDSTSKDDRPSHTLIFEPTIIATKLNNTGITGLDGASNNIRKYKLQQKTVSKQMNRNGSSKGRIIRPNRLTTTTMATVAPYEDDTDDDSASIGKKLIATEIPPFEARSTLSREARRLAQLISDEDLAAFQRVMTILMQNQMFSERTGIQGLVHNNPGQNFFQQPITTARTTEAPRVFSVEISCKKNSPCSYRVTIDVYCMHPVDPNGYYQCSPGPDGRGVWVVRQCPAGLKFYKSGECGLNFDSQQLPETGGQSTSSEREDSHVGNSRVVSRPIIEIPVSIEEDINSATLTYEEQNAAKLSSTPPLKNNAIYGDNRRDLIRAISQQILPKIPSTPSGQQSAVAPYTFTNFNPFFVNIIPQSSRSVWPLPRNTYANLSSMTWPVYAVSDPRVRNNSIAKSAVPESAYPLLTSATVDHGNVKPVQTMLSSQFLHAPLNLQTAASTDDKNSHDEKGILNYQPGLPSNSWTNYWQRQGTANANGIGYAPVPSPIQAPNLAYDRSATYYPMRFYFPRLHDDSEKPT